MGAPTITGSINVGKIDKSLLFEGKKGKYLNIAVFELNEPDQFGNTHMIVQEVSKEERERGVKGPIIGNAKTRSSSRPEPSRYAKQSGGNGRYAKEYPLRSDQDRLRDPQPSGRGQDDGDELDF